jgi:hypothetical protein
MKIGKSYYFLLFIYFDLDLLVSSFNASFEVQRFGFKESDKWLIVPALSEGEVCANCDQDLEFISGFEFQLVSAIKFNDTLQIF